MRTDQEALESEKRFTAYIEQLASVMGHAAQEGPLNAYCTGLVLPFERTSVEPLAALTEAGHASAQHQSLRHFVGEAPWRDEAVLAKVCELVLPSLARQEPMAAWLIDDTAIAKKGKPSVGVAHQYGAQLPAFSANNARLHVHGKGLQSRAGARAPGGAKGQTGC
jgi:SRSO17 transposase